MAALIRSKFAAAVGAEPLLAVAPRSDSECSSRDALLLLDRPSGLVLRHHRHRQVRRPRPASLAALTACHCRPPARSVRAGPSLTRRGLPLPSPPPPHHHHHTQEEPDCLLDDLKRSCSATSSASQLSDCCILDSGEASLSCASDDCLLACGEDLGGLESPPAEPEGYQPCGGGAGAQGGADLLQSPSSCAWHRPPQPAPAPALPADCCWPPPGTQGDCCSPADVREMLR